MTAKNNEGVGFAMPMTQQEYWDYLDNAPEAPDFYEVVDNAPTAELRSRLDSFHEKSKDLLHDYGGFPELTEDLPERFLAFLDEADELSEEISDIMEKCEAIVDLLDKLKVGLPDSLYESL